jgi:hypothetical protein
MTYNPTPWVRFKNELIKMMDAGVLEPGDEVCISLEAADFGITQHPAERAFRALVREGKLLPSPGPGRPYRVPQRKEEE